LPPSIRSGVIGFTYALAIAIFGGSAQFMVQWLIGVLHSPLAPGLYMSGALLIGIVARLALPLKTDSLKIGA
jgi:MFS transporter, MHS family, citrate/tricarballylate:H+ symporter